jgi:hypothetical protein
LAAVVADASLSQADIAALPEAQRAMYSARPEWSVVASFVAVIGGTLGTAALIFRRRWAQPLLLASLVGVVVQDLALFFIVGRSAQLGTAVFVLQGVVLVVAVALVLLVRKASALSWLR